MCNYCENLTSDKMDAYQHKYRDLLRTEYWSNDFNKEDLERMASIDMPTPVSIRRHKEDGLTASIEIYLADDKRRVHHMNIPIRYCPICGRDLTNKSV